MALPEYVITALFVLTIAILVAIVFVIYLIQKTIRRINRVSGSIKRLYVEIEKANKGVSDVLVAAESLKSSLSALSEPMLNLLDRLSRLISRASAEAPEVQEAAEEERSPLITIPEEIPSLDVLPHYGVESVVIVSSDGLPVDSYPRGAIRELGGLYVALYRMASQLIENVNWLALSSAEGEVYVVRLEDGGEYYATLTLRRRDVVPLLPALTNALSKYLSRKLAQHSSD